MRESRLRQWQANFLDHLASDEFANYLLVACPAAGKTIAGTVAGAFMMGRTESTQLIVVAPTVVVRDQWTHALRSAGFHMLDRLPTGKNIPPWVHGVCVTYAQAAYRADVFSEACQARGTVVIFDEVHHASEHRTWGAGMMVAFEGANFRLMLSGTPFRSDGHPIPFISYDETGACVPDFVYDYPQAVKDGVCRPIEFHAHDGSIAWWSQDGEEAEADLSAEIDGIEVPRRLRAALETTQPYIRSLLERAHHELTVTREEIPDAAGLVICDSQAHAREVTAILAEISSSCPTLAISDIPSSHAELERFGGDTSPWLVSVKMVAEGVDIPRLTVISWLSATSTELMVRQVAGRALRGRPQYSSLKASVHMPADPRLVAHAESFEIMSGIASSDDLGPIGPANETGERRSPRPGGCIAALATNDPPQVIVPDIDVPSETECSGSGLQRIVIELPELPPSPSQVEATRERNENVLAETMRLLRLYTELRRDDRPTFQIAAAQAQLEEAVGPLCDEDGLVRVDVLEDALAWVREATARLAIAKPSLTKEIARRSRRLRLATEVAA